MKSEWVRMAKERGNMKVRVMREKVLGDNDGIDKECLRISGMVRNWSSSGATSIAGRLLKRDEERAMKELIGVAK